MKARMYNPPSALVKREFYNKWIKGLRIFNNFKKQMTVPERKNAIKLSADVAIASTRNAATRWSQALMAGVSDSGAARAVVEQIWGRNPVEKKAALTMTRSNEIVRRSRLAHRRKKACRRSGVVRSSVKVARKLVKSRTRVLKRLVPGGQGMDEILLIKETLDYIASLQVQVDVMRHLAAAAERLDHQPRFF